MSDNHFSMKIPSLKFYIFYLSVISHIYYRYNIRITISNIQIGIFCSYFYRPFAKYSNWYIFNLSVIYSIYYRYNARITISDICPINKFIYDHMMKSFTNHNLRNSIFLRYIGNFL